MMSAISKLACKAGGFAGGMIRKQRLRTTGRHFERANKGETGERKKEKGRGWGRGKRREEGGGSAGGFAGGMIRKQRLRTTGRHFERANKGETGERKKEKGRGWGRGKRREEGGSGGAKNRLPGN